MITVKYLLALSTHTTSGESKTKARLRMESRHPVFLDLQSMAGILLKTSMPGLQVSSSVLTVAELGQLNDKNIKSDFSISLR